MSTNEAGLGARGIPANLPDLELLARMATELFGAFPATQEIAQSIAAVSPPNCGCSARRGCSGDARGSIGSWDQPRSKSIGQSRACRPRHDAHNRRLRLQFRAAPRLSFRRPIRRRPRVFLFLKTPALRSVELSHWQLQSSSHRPRLPAGRDTRAGGAVRRGANTGCT